MAASGNGLVVRTSQKDWLISVAKAYKAQVAFELVDDGNVGVNPINQTLLDMGRKANLSQREWIALMISLGMGAAGAWLLVMAVLDPEPYSKIAFALGSGVFLTCAGGYSSIRILIGHKPPSVSVSPRGGFAISWD